MVSIPENQVTQQDMERWYTVQEQLSKLKNEEQLLRKKIFTGMFHDPVEGTNSVDLGDGFVLKGKRVIFTNGSTVHAHRVLKKLGIDDLFDGVFALEDADLIPKPDPRTFQKMLAMFGIDPTTACFFEDTPQNLAPAKDIGMTTVLVGPKAFSAEGDFIDYRAASLPPFLTTAILDGDPE